MSRFWLRACALFALIFLFAFSLTAQVQNGVLTGTVLDPSGAAVPNAKVTVKNTDTGLTTTATTNQSGLYSARELPVGTYTITAQAPGFKTVSRTGIALTVGSIQRVDLHMEVGQVSQTVEVSGAAPAVNTEDSRLATTVESNQISNLPLNGRNVYALIQQAPGAVNVRGVLSENGAGTVVNGLREDFNGFLLNGVSNKGLSGGVDTQPIADSVQEFQLLTLNMSAQYGNSAGSITNLVTKAGTNSYHGDVWEFIRNDALDAMDFYTAHTSDPTARKKSPLRFNQFGGTFGGPVIKDKLFFFGSYQGDRFVTSSTGQVQTESPQWRQAVEAAAPNSVAALLYKNFAPTTPVTGVISTVDQFIKGNPSGSGLSSYSDYLCPLTFAEGYGMTAAQSMALATRFASLIGVQVGDYGTTNHFTQSGACTTTDPTLAGLGPLPVQAGTMDRNAPMLVNVTKNSLARSITGTESSNLFNGNEASVRIDYNPSDKDRIFGQYNFFRSNDEFFSGISAPRPFANPETFSSPNFQLSFVHTFSPTVLNEFRTGYVGSHQTISVSTPGVPEVGFDDGTLAFGSYSGYPQTFHENVYTYSDMVSIQHGNHAIKIGADLRRNLENSNFNVGRPSYFMSDEMFFAADAPYGMAAGVDPGFVSGQPAHLDTNERHWRNWEIGAYLQDDWKATRKLTLNLGLRYDLFTRHKEENGLVTTFLPGPGNNIIDQIKNANAPLGSPGCLTPANSTQILAGVCGPGGFAKASSLGAGDHNDFGPRIGFAYDMFGNGKTALRGGFGVSYEGTLYNPLSNSRWNPPYYSFNEAFNALGGDTSTVPYGPQSGGVPRYTGGPDPNNFQGTNPATATGNIQGWAPSNPDQAILTGIVFPQGIRDPYVYNWYLGVQHEIAAKTVLEVDYVGTAGHKLFRAQNVNRMAGDRLPQGVCSQDMFGRTLCSNRSAFNQGGHAYLNPNYGNLRAWENVTNSNYNALQASLRHQLSHRVEMNIQYTWSHSLDDGSTWHSGATSANGAAAGEGYSTDQTIPQLDYGNSIYDIRHRLSANYVIMLPWQDKSGFAGKVLGGWQVNGLVAVQSGAHWSPFCGGFYGTCDFNLDGVANDRPNSDVTNFTPSHAQWADGWGDAWVFGNPGSHFTDPNPIKNADGISLTANPGNLGRNTFVGPGYWTADLSLVKNLHITERVNFQFRAESFNLFNHTNFQLPGNNGNNKIEKGTFGCACSTFDPRVLQFGAKVIF